VFPRRLRAEALFRHAGHDSDVCPFVSWGSKGAFGICTHVRV
jgi:hypothetical protein